MTKQVIVVGDTLAPYGGVVISGANEDLVDGRVIVRRGDMVDCAEHGVNPIIEGDTSSVIAGKVAALHGHRSACGCTLVSVRATLSIG